MNRSIIKYLYKYNIAHRFSVSLGTRRRHGITNTHRNVVKGCAQIEITKIEKKSLKKPNTSPPPFKYVFRFLLPTFDILQQKNLYNHIISFFLSPRLNQHLTFTNVEVALDFLFSSLTPSHYSSISNRGNQPQVTHRRFGHHTNTGRKVCTNCLFLLSFAYLSLCLSVPPTHHTQYQKKKQQSSQQKGIYGASIIIMETWRLEDLDDLRI